MATIKKETRKKGIVWSVRWYDAGNKERKKTFAYRHEADDWAARMTVGGETAELKVRETEELTFSDFADRWFEQYCKVHKSSSSWKDDRMVIDLHLKPAFGSKRLSELDRMDLKYLQGILLKRRTKGKQKPLSPKTVNNVTSLAHKIMEDCAAEWRLVPENPFRGYKRLRVTRQPFDYWSISERDTFLEHCKVADPEFYDFFAVALFTGCRLGEIQALKRDCLDFDLNRITIRRKYYDKTQTFSDCLKMGKEARRLPMNSQLREVLGRYRFQRADQLLFPLRSGFCYRKHLKVIAKGAGVKVLRVHDTRHTFASNLAMAGVPLIKIQQMLGHEKISETMRYAHLCPGATDGATEVLVSKPKPSESVASSSGQP